MSTGVKMDVPTDRGAERAARIAARHARLLETDAQYRAATPPEAVTALKKDRSVRVAQLIAAIMEACAERTAVAWRKTRIVEDPVTGRRSAELLETWETRTYAELWRDIRGLVSVWQRDPSMRVRPGELVCILGFAGAGYVIGDIAATLAGAVTVPLQTNAGTAQLAAILHETEARCLMASAECLDTAVEMILAGHSPAALLVFDYEPGDDDQREAYERAARRLADAGVRTQLATLAATCTRGATLGEPTLVVPPLDQDPLTVIFYTSGSTGSPKGAMIGERTSGIAWRAPDARPLITVNYMPMNHSYGRNLVLRTLAAGGTAYFAARSDLSTFFDDIRLVRPTFINVVTRICEMFHARCASELAARGPGADPAAIERDFREHAIGGRLLAAAFGAAPLTAELRAFIERCLDVALPINYGATEIMGVSQDNKILRPPVIDWKLVDVPDLGYFLTDKPWPRGELLVKTGHIMQGYYKNPQATAAVFDPDGFYRTGDVMAQTGPDEIIYVDRRNNVQKLAQGEFVAIAQLEAAYTSGHPLIDQVYLYGTSDRAFLLGVIVPSPQELARRDLSLADDAAVKAALRAALQEVAQAGQLQSYEVPRDFIVEPEPFSPENGLLTNVRKPRRPALKERYAPRLEAMYDEIENRQSDELRQLREHGRDLSVPQTVTRAVQATLGIESIEAGEPLNFADLGGDSLSALTLSMLLEEIYGIEVPVGVITHPSGSLASLAAFIERTRSGERERATFASVHGRDAKLVRAADLTLEKFIEPTLIAGAASLPQPAAGAPRAVLLTGANGFLGRFLCLNWLERFATNGGRLTCIVRARDDAAARERVLAVFDSGDPELSARVRALAAEHLEVLAGDIAERNLGLDDATWQRLAASVDLIVHPAALVNHVLPYAQLFGPNVAGTAELVRLALTHHLKRFVNVSTVAAAFTADRRALDESTDVRAACPERELGVGTYAAGYATSKWAAEVLLREANARCALPVANFRSDMILAHSRWRGQLNVPDMFTRLIFSLVQTGTAPGSFYRRAADGGRARAHYDGLPVDFSAESIVAIGEHFRSGYHDFHVVNPHDDGIGLDQIVDWIAASGRRMQRVDDYADWLQRFETALRRLPEAQSAQSFLPLLHQLREPMRAASGAQVSARRFHAAVRDLALGPDGDIPQLSRNLIEKYLDDLVAVGLLV